MHATCVIITTMHYLLLTQHTCNPNLPYCFAGRFATDNAYAILDVVPCAKVQAFQQAYIQHMTRHETIVEGELILPPIQGTTITWMCKQHPLMPVDNFDGQKQCRECAGTNLMSWVRVEAQIRTPANVYHNIIIAHDMVINLWPQLDVNSPCWYQDASMDNISGRFVLLHDSLLVGATLPELDAH
jgi:hypothetical protein